MSLTVGLFRETSEGRWEDVPFDPPPPRTDQAGGASWKRLVYGGTRARELGLRLLPTLADRDPLFIRGPDLIVLRGEVEALKASYLQDYGRKRASGATATDSDLQLVSCLDNILSAVQFALDNHGMYGVCIG